MWLVHVGRDKEAGAHCSSAIGPCDHGLQRMVVQSRGICNVPPTLVGPATSLTISHAKVDAHARLGAHPSHARSYLVGQAVGQHLSRALAVARDEEAAYLQKGLAHALTKTERHDCGTNGFPDNGPVSALLFVSVSRVNSTPLHPPCSVGCA